MITLPPPRRARLRAFWLVQSAYTGFFAIVLGRILTVPQYILLGIVVGLLVALSGLWWSRKIATLYQAWDQWAEWYALWASMLLVRICYYVVFTSVGCAGSTINRDRTSQSGWVRRNTLSPNAYLAQYDLTYPGSSRSWVAGYLGWAYKSGNIWAWSLLPFLIVIAALDVQKGEMHRVSIYTLF